MTVMNGYGLGGFGGMFMLLFMIFVIAGIIWLALALSRSQLRSGDDPSSSTAPRILEERLARGEIDAEEFRTRRAALEGLSK